MPAQITIKNFHLTASTGGNSLLTDPQISSTQYDNYFLQSSNPANIVLQLLDLLELFFFHQNFEKKHVCNEFCKWSNIPTDYDTASGGESD